MHLSDDRILELARTNLARLVADIDDPGVKHQFAAIDSALHELALRNDKAAQRDYYQAGSALAREGEPLVDDRDIAAAVDALPTELQADVDSDVYQRALSALTDCLHRIVKAIGADEEATRSQYLERVCAWEYELPRRRSERLAAIDAGAASEGFTRERFEEYLRGRFPSRKHLRVRDFAILPGGYSKRTIFLSVEDDAGLEPLVIRANQPTRNIKTDGADVRQEYSVLLFAFKAGLLLPEPLWLETDESLFGASFVVCRKAVGRTIGSGHTNQMFQAITPEIRAELVRRMLQVHSTPIDPNDEIIAKSHLVRWLPHRDLRATAIASVNFWMQEIYDQGGAVGPSLQRVYDWLIANAPPAIPYTPVFLHGDFGLHNILFEGERISVLLDWEIAKIGDPAEEFLPLFMSLATDYDEALIRDYMAAGGQPVSRFRITYYLLLILLRVLVFDAALTRNLATARQADMNLFNWMTTTSPIMLRNLNALIARAERERAEEYGNS